MNERKTLCSVLKSTFVLPVYLDFYSKTGVTLCVGRKSGMQELDIKCGVYKETCQNALVNSVH